MAYAANDNTDLCYVVFYDSDSDDAQVAHIEGPFQSVDDAINYNITAYQWAKENGVPWFATETIHADEIGAYGNA